MRHSVETTIRVNGQRLQAAIGELARIGAREGRGITRPFGCAEDLEARSWLRAYAQRLLGRPMVPDAAANLWVTLPGREALPAIALGSHHDTVPCGGPLDGAMGVLLALEVLARVREEGIFLRHPLAAVSFTGEEPNAFHLSTLGSKIASGKLTRPQLWERRDASGQVLLRDALREAGGDIERLGEALITRDTLCAFVECHVEQGRRLEDADGSLGVASEITGIYRERVFVTGEANHSGTTLMRFRRDALPAAAQAVLMVEEAAASLNRDEVVSTVGCLSVSPNSANIIPGEVELLLEVRSIDEDLICRAVARLDGEFARLERERGVRIRREILLNQPVKPLDETLTRCLCRSVKALGESCPLLPSMAGHDCGHIGDVARAGLLFVRSIGGLSHCPGEDSRPGDIQKAGDALIGAVRILDGELDA